ncbi:MAG: hypothetical protein WDW36_006035 [Sanguina aurantia]
MTQFVSQSTVRVLLKELHSLQDSPCEGVHVIVNENNLADIQAEMLGPPGTPYEGGLFRMRLTLAADHPSSPPKGFFTTKIFHPNVSAAGEICVNVLKKDWTADMGLRHVLMVIRCLLIQPFPDSALNEEAGKLLQDDYEEYSSRARLMTSIHAAKRSAPEPCAASASCAPGSTPLTTSGANIDGSRKEGAAASAPPVSPVKKSTTGVGVNSGIAKAKKSLKRL